MSEKTENMMETRIQRTPNGIALTIKSKVLEDWMKNNRMEGSNMEQSSNPGWNGIKGYKLKEIKDFDLFNYWGGALNQPSPNLSFFRAEGLGEGVTFNLEGIYSKQVLDKWVQDARTHMIGFYKRYIKTKDITLSVTISEIE